MNPEAPTVQLGRLEAGMPILFGGDRLTHVPTELAEAFAPGDRLLVLQDSGDLIHVTADDLAVAAAAVGKARLAFADMGHVPDEAIAAFFHGFADRLDDGPSFEPIAAANAADVDRSRSMGRSTTRLELTSKMRSEMSAGLRAWAARPTGRDAVLRRVEHDGWSVEQRRAGLGVVGFVFEGRPNVFADAAGVVASGNTVVFRIGSDALGTARAIVTHALEPALDAAGLPPGACSLVDSPSRGAGHAMFSDSRLSLAVARGSGRAVAQLGAVARQAGVAVSLHGTGGAWIVAGPEADANRLAAVVEHSLDRKVCNTLNTCAVVAERADELVPVVLAALERSAERLGTRAKLHVVDGQEGRIGAEWFHDRLIARAEGDVAEPGCEVLGWDDLGIEWEWEQSPEITLVIVDDVDAAVERFNACAPGFVASLIDEDAQTQEHFWARVDAPFVGDGFTRWVDGQYAFDEPELGLSNWEGGRLFGRGGVLSGDSVFTVRSRVVQTDPDLRR